jgi:hypothetical protein
MKFCEKWVVEQGLFNKLLPAKEGEYMPLQNRVKPNGEIVVSESRGSMMGNRGNLHNGRKELIRQTKSNYRGWVNCLLKFNGIQREVMSPGKYTELFFLDEATAFSAGHRPCNDCQKDRLKEFKNIWLSANESAYTLTGTNLKDIDEVIQEERIDTNGNKVTCFSEITGLPDGTFIELEDKYFLKWRSSLLEWSFDGYVSAVPIPSNKTAKVLTPKSIVRCFSSGFLPKVHESAKKYCS